MAFRYDVFLWYRHSSMTTDFASSLLKTLRSKNIEVYEDSYNESLLKDPAVEAIDESKIFVIIIDITPDFEDLRFSLVKLEKIINNWKRNGQLVIPVFLNVELRYYFKSFSNNMSEQVLAKSGHMFEKDEADRWVHAVSKLAALPGRINASVSKYIDTPKYLKNKDMFVEKIILEVMENLEVMKNLKSNRKIVKGKSQCSIGMTILLVINLLLEIASVVADQLSSVRKPYFSRISVVMSVLSVVLSLIDLTYKIHVNNVCFQCKWPIPWFYYRSRNFNRRFGSFPDMILLFCGVGQLIVSTINCIFIQNRHEGPINISVWPLFFAIFMVICKFVEEPTTLTKMY